MIDFALAALAPAAMTALLIRMLGRSPLARELADEPNERSLHAVAKPRLGGLGLLAGAMPVAFAYGSETLAPVLGCMVALALLSFADDLSSLPAPMRFAAHLAAAAIALAAIANPIALDDAPSLLLAAVLVLAVVWMTNLYNFMDGADGLAGGMALIGFATLAAAAYTRGDAGTALACAAIASSSAAFLAFNFPPARVFLGDAGSIPLGFAAAAFALHGIEHDLWPWWFVPLVFSPFIVDASVTLVARLARGERVWTAHRTHFYQRLALTGLAPRSLALRFYALAGLCAASALVARDRGWLWQLGILLGWSAAYPLILIAIERHARSVRNVAATPDRPDG